MKGRASLRYRLARFSGRFVTRTAALFTAGQMPPFVSTSVVVVVHDRLLTVIDPIRKEAILPGGHLRWAENPPDAAAREVKEETGYVICVGNLIGVYAGRELAGERGVVRVVYSGQIISGALLPSAEGMPTWVPVRTYAASAARDAPIVHDWIDQAPASRPED